MVGTLDKIQTKYLLNTNLMCYSKGNKLKPYVWLNGTYHILQNNLKIF